jgi:hypothetical protein
VLLCKLSKISFHQDMPYVCWTYLNTLRVRRDLKEKRTETVFEGGLALVTILDREHWLAKVSNKTGTWSYRHVAELHGLRSGLGRIDPGYILPSARIFGVGRFNVINCFHSDACVYGPCEFLADIVASAKLGYELFVGDVAQVLVDAVNHRMNRGLKTKRAEHFKHNHV